MVKSFFFVCGIFWASVALAQSSHHCGSISNSDQRAMCRALAEKKAHHCGSISDSDQRAMCRAQSEGKSHHCGSISSTDLRAQCRALAGN